MYPPQNVASNLLDHAIYSDVELSQYGVKTGVRKFGDAAINTIIQECNHLDTINALHPVCKQDLNKEQLLKALGAITMVKMKRCGRMKGRTITNGSSQHEYTAKED